MHTACRQPVVNKQNRAPFRLLLFRTAVVVLAVVRVTGYDSLSLSLPLSPPQRHVQLHK